MAGEAEKWSLQEPTSSSVVRNETLPEEHNVGTPTQASDPGVYTVETSPISVCIRKIIGLKVKTGSPILKGPCMVSLTSPRGLTHLTLRSSESNNSLKSCEGAMLSHFSRVRLCATLEMAAHQAPPSLGFSRQEHWSGLPFPSPIVKERCL